MRKTSRQFTQRALFVVAAITLGVVSLLAAPAAYAQQQTGRGDRRRVVDSATNGAHSGGVGAWWTGPVSVPSRTRTASTRSRTCRPEQHTLVARRIGYAPHAAHVTVGAEGQVTVNFALTAAATSLNEVIVTGTAGGQERREIGNAVSTSTRPNSSPSRSRRISARC